MSRLNVLSFFIAISLAVTLLGVLVMGYLSGQVAALRLEMLESWEWIESLVAFALAVLVLWCWAAPTIYTGDKVYRRMMPASPSGLGALVTAFETPGKVMAIAGGAILALGLMVLAGHAFDHRPMQLPFPIPAYIMMALGVLVIGSRYSAVIDGAGGRLLQTVSVLGLKLTRRTDFSGSAKVRLREEISFAGKGHNRAPSSSYYLEVVDRDTVIPLSTSGTPAAAANLAAHLQKSEYEHLTCDFTGRKTPLYSESLLTSVPVERLSAMSPRIAVLCLLLGLALPQVYKQAIQGERQATNTSNSEIGARMMRAQDGHRLEDQHLNDVGPVSDAARVDYLKALVIWEGFLKEDPEDPEAVLARGRLRLRLGQLEDGLADVEHFRRLLPRVWRDQGSSMDRRYDLPESLLVRAYWQSGDLKMALEISDKNHIRSEGLRGLVLADLGRKDEARESLELERKAYRPDPETIAALEKKLGH